MDQLNKPLFSNVDCISLYVDDLDEGIKFYHSSLGLKPLWRTTKACGLAMPNDVCELVLCLEKNPLVDFKVGDVSLAIKEYEKAGGEVLYGPFDIDIGKCVVVKDKWDNQYCLLDMSKGTYDTDEKGIVSGVSKK